jgi:predicted ArsR family transcriptional regulator
MIETIESYRPHVIAALTQAGPDGLTVKELRASLGAGEQVIRRTLTVLLATGAVRASLRYRPGVRGAVPRVYQLAG